jgi:hypothetical protein
MRARVGVARVLRSSGGVLFLSRGGAVEGPKPASLNKMVDGQSAHGFIAATRNTLGVRMRVALARPIRAKSAIAAKRCLAVPGGEFTIGWRSNSPGVVPSLNAAPCGG